MLFLLDGTPGSDISAFLSRLQEETLAGVIILYSEWITLSENSLCAHSELAVPSIALCEGWVEESSAHKKRALEDNPSTSSGRARGITLGKAQKQECHEQPDGIIFMRVSPEIAYKRIQSRAQSTSLTLDYIKQIYAEKEQFFIENKNNPKELEKLPILVLNGNIDFQTDFAQFYNHLFYIRRFIIQIQDKKDIALGIHKEKVPHRHCC